MGATDDTLSSFDTATAVVNETVMPGWLDPGFNPTFGHTDDAAHDGAIGAAVNSTVGDRSDVSPVFEAKHETVSGANSVTDG